MKYYLWLLAGLLLITSCSDDDGNGGGDSSDDQFSCVVDGASHSIKGKYAWAEEIASDLFVVYGSEDQTQAGFTNVFISFVGRPTVGIYDLSDSDVALGTWIDTGSGASFISVIGGSGTAEVTSIDAERITGTFSFVGGDTNGATKTITEGKFDVRIGF